MPNAVIDTNTRECVGMVNTSAIKKKIEGKSDKDFSKNKDFDFTRAGQRCMEDSGGKCYHRGSPNHLAHDKRCPALHQRCSKCNVKGHFNKCLSESHREDPQVLTLHEEVLEIEGQCRKKPIREVIASGVRVKLVAD
ncbi:hypothetical protein NDU88_011591 [Pleurodeles waltl]|uniref:Uncharacterized protein n=1 Tax=Pleurodeles waltl TaxID=8319 RepID=A0AAV7Q242_PLEWA|nr:hypothetical protein NDU88_011591 [Pleurodeles waltl]